MSGSICFNVDSPLENDEVQAVLREGTDLRKYSEETEKQLKEVENQSVLEYVKESQNIVNLHGQIVACDDILERMEKMLLGFQNDLGSISSEIVYLQRKSVAMSQQLHNRQAVRGQLSQFIDDMAVPEQLIMTMKDYAVTDREFLTQLVSLDHKISYSKQQAGAKSVSDVAEVLDNLKIKAVVKIRTYLLEQIAKFRKPMTNYQVPQNTLLKFKELFEFVLTHEKMVAQEVCSEYVDTMSKIYFSYFKSYIMNLNKLTFEEQAMKDDLMGVEDGGGALSKATGAAASLFGKGTVPLKQKNTIFTIGSRGEVLTSLLDAPIIIPHSAAKADLRFPYEALFRSEQYALVDNACREFLFVCEFFKVSGQQASQLFSQIMGRTLTLLIKSVESYTATSYDCIALFLCIQLVFRYQLICHKRAVPALDAYWDKLQIILWPRFEQIFQMNILSVKNCDPSKFSKEMKPHYITRRFAELSGALVALSESFPNEKLTHLLALLTDQVQCFLLRMAAIFPNRIHQLVFLINNYDMALGILQERVRDSPCKEADMLRVGLTNCSSEYVEEVLSPYIGGIMQFVKEAESLQAAGNLEQLKQLQDKCSSLVHTFSTRWKESLESLNKEILSSFPSLLTGSTLLQLSLASFLQYYERFHKVLTPEVRAVLVNIHHIKVDLKKYRTNYS